MRLTLVSHGLGAGGAERVMSRLANHWVAAGKTVSLITINNDPPFYRLSPEIDFQPLAMQTSAPDAVHRLLQSARRLRRLRNALRNSSPDVVVSFQTPTNLSVLLASIGLGHRVIVSERVDPRFFADIPHVRVLRNRLYRRASAIVVQCDRFLEALPASLHSRCTTIANPVEKPEIASMVSQSSFPQPFIAAMGRLTRQKGFDLLIDAFATLHPRFPDWSLVILGEGELRGELTAAVQHHGLGGAVHLPGVIVNPQQVLSQCSVFALPSRFEGFPNALCEAMACGAAVVAADCRCGPREVIRDGVDGLLVEPENVAALAAALEKLMINEQLSAQLRHHAREITERFSVAKVAESWECLLDDCLPSQRMPNASSRGRAA